MKAQRFGSAHTEKKLQLVAAYLKAFATAMKKQSFTKIYVDAFAGTGAWQSRTNLGDAQVRLLDVETISEGSVARALRVEPPFGRYLFIEKSRKKSSALARLGDQFPALRERIEVVPRDANEALREFCAKTDWSRTRAVVFLDPFGFQVEWATAEALARTEAVDLWYLVPTGIGINRQIGRDGQIHLDGGKRVDIMLGTTEWRSRWVTTEADQVNLFGEPIARSAKSGGVEEIAEFVLDRLAGIFKGGVAKYALPLGSHGQAWYTLVFACANPSPKASQLAMRLANAVLKT